ncbi:hypothetical protein B0O99DRAFT_530396 [Bisporella sp. PMI_857]|nr:hypothetical protein B0O99DRAFT_530396 [Bisporella sp. PMI_857]
MTHILRLFLPRLNLQHFWNQLSLGYQIHPDILFDAHARIADIATGTGIWPLALSRSLASTVQIDGFDISDAQFPPKKWLPANVTLDTLDILEPIPDQFLGKYDVVNIRYFALSIKNSDHLGVLKSLISLLKPGGYLQWVEVNIQKQSVVSVTLDTPSIATSDFNDTGKAALPTLGVAHE